MSGLEERPVKKREEVSRLRREVIDARLNEIVSLLRAPAYEERYYGFPSKGIMAEFVVGTLCFVGGIMAFLTTSELWSIVFIVIGVLMLGWGIEDRAYRLAWEEGRRVRNVEIPYPYMRRITIQEYEKWVLEQNERNRRNTEGH